MQLKLSKPFMRIGQFVTYDGQLYIIVYDLGDALLIGQVGQELIEVRSSDCLPPPDVIDEDVEYQHYIYLINKRQGD